MRPVELNTIVGALEQAFEPHTKKRMDEAKALLKEGLKKSSEEDKKAIRSALALLEQNRETPFSPEEIESVRHALSLILKKYY